MSGYADLAMLSRNGPLCRLGIGSTMVGLAAAMFVGLFAFGYQFFGWTQAAHEHVQMGLFLSFILGIICGYKTRG